MPVPLECEQLPRIPEATRPYLNPAYWDGYRLGVSRSTALPSFEADPEMRDFAVDMLKPVLASAARGGTIREYVEGSVFAAKDHHPGTVVILDRESLVIDISDGEVPTGEKPSYVDMAAFIGDKLLPPQPNPIDWQLQQRGSADRPQLSFEPYILLGGGIAYMNLALWGVVVLDEDGHNQLVTMPSGVVTEKSERSTDELKAGLPGKIQVYDSIDARVEVGDIPVGKVQVTNGRKLSAKRLSRVNSIDVVAEAEPIAA